MALRGGHSSTRANSFRARAADPATHKLARAELFNRACEQQLLKHLKAVCLWPARDRDKTWRLGDFSSYSLGFTPPRRASVIVQFWSEPDERSNGGAVTFEVASDAWVGAGRRSLDARRQELLRDHGFERASRRNGTTVNGHFRKEILLGSGRSIRALVRETIAILCKVLDYDGSSALEFHLHLGTRLNAGYTFDGICAPTCSSSCIGGACRRKSSNGSGQAPLIKSMVQEQPFLVAFVGERQGVAGEYGMIGLRTFMRFEGGVPEGLAERDQHEFRDGQGQRRRGRGSGRADADHPARRRRTREPRDVFQRLARNARGDPAGLGVTDAVRRRLRAKRPVQRTVIGAMICCAARP